MPKYLCKVSQHKGQYRLTIPKALVASMGWEDVKYLLLKEASESAVWMRRFVDGQTLRESEPENLNGSGR